MARTMWVFWRRTVLKCTSPGVQGRTMHETVLCMPMDCEDWTSFHVSPHRLCNLISRHYLCLRHLACYNRPRRDVANGSANALKQFLENLPGEFRRSHIQLIIDVLESSESDAAKWFQDVADSWKNHVTESLQ